MNLLSSFEQVDIAALAPLRERYLESLPEPQELLLELLVPHCTAYAVVSKGERCGYFLVHEEHTLLELYLERTHWLYGEALFLQILERTRVRRALVKSFDALLLSSTIAHQRGVKSLGLLVRDYVPRPLPNLAQIRFEPRRAEAGDIPAILRVDQQVFRDPARLAHVIDERNLVLFERDGSLVGFGIIRPVIAGRPEVDLGIAVDAPYRNKGYAVFIFRDMVEYCFRQGLRPIAGCAEQNLPSRRMGERVGMVARHRLLELTFEAPAHSG